MILRALVGHMLHESVHRSASLASVVAAVGLTLLMLLPLRVREGEVIYWNQRSSLTAPMMARQLSSVAVGTGQTIWVFLPLIAVAGLMASCQQKGWVELLFSKPFPRVTLLASVYLCGLVLWLMSVGLTVSSLAAAFRWMLHVPAAPLLQAFAVMTLVFAAELSFLLLVAVARPNVMIASAATFAMTFIASLMGLRASVARYFDSEWLRGALDGVYYVLPKVGELTNLAGRLSETPATKIADWMPIWSTGLFGAGCLIAAAWLLAKKDF